jgi:hypothetical protein
VNGPSNAASGGRPHAATPISARDRVAAVHDPERSRTARRARVRRRRRHLLAVLVVTLTTVGASGGVLWLATHLLPQSLPGGDGEPPVADAVELLKVALAVGLSKWAQAA